MTGSMCFLFKLIGSRKTKWDLELLATGSVAHFPYRLRVCNAFPVSLEIAYVLRVGSGFKSRSVYF